MMKDLKLTEHFSLKELCVTNVKNVDNEPPAIIHDNLIEIAEDLEKLRFALGGEPIVINSGYRSKEVNKAVGGSPTSYHLRGCAVDIKCRNLDDACRKMATLARLCPDFDELYIEGDIGSESVWLHYANDPWSPGRHKVGVIRKKLR